MFEFSYSPNGVPLVRQEGFAFLPDQPGPGLFTLELGSSLRFSTMDAVLGEYPESLALPGMRRPHTSADGAELSLDAASAIPFESEPSIERAYRLLEGSLFVQTDFILRNSFAMKSIVAGGLRIEGIRKYSLTPAPVRTGAVTAKPLSDFESVTGGTVLWDDPAPPLIISVEGDDGQSAEFNTGALFWRWINAARISGRSRYLVKKEDGALVFHWNLYEFVPEVPDAQPLPGRNWRLSWSIRWGAPAAIPDGIKATFDLAEGPWSPSACAAGTTGKAGKAPCCCAAAVQNTLKKWLRGQLADVAEGDVFAVKNAADRFCFAASHMDRPKLKTLAHWDRDFLGEFLRWGNRQLRPYGARVIALPAEPKSKKSHNKPNHGEME